MVSLFVAWFCIWNIIGFYDVRGGKLIFTFLFYAITLIWIAGSVEYLFYEQNWWLSIKSVWNMCFELGEVPIAMKLMVNGVIAFIVGMIMLIFIFENKINQGLAKLFGKMFGLMDRAFFRSLRVARMKKSARSKLSSPARVNDLQRAIRFDFDSSPVVIKYYQSGKRRFVFKSAKAPKEIF